VKIGASTLGLLLIGFATLSITILSAWMPDFDVTLAERLFDPTSKTFPTASLAVLELLRQQGLASVVSVVACIGVALFMKFILPRRRLLIPGRAIIFLALTLAIGPGLLVNAILKPHWGRPRPAEIVQFGGHEDYVPWWKTNGHCTSNCSFVSGESSVAAWLFAPAVLIPPPWRAAAVGAAGIFTVAIGLSRMAFGGHFFTDVAFGTLMTLVVIWVMYALIFIWPPTRLDEQVMERRMSRFSCRLRRVLFYATRNKNPHRRPIANTRGQLGSQ
jgi:lipid A 4'-phosphatase